MLTTDEFAKRIKEKYPEYGDMDNAVLTERIIEKYPEYKDHVQIEKPPSIIAKAKNGIGKEISAADNAIRGFVDRNQPGQVEEIEGLKKSIANAFSGKEAEPVAPTPLPKQSLEERLSAKPEQMPQEATAVPTQLPPEKSVEETALRAPFRDQVADKDPIPFAPPEQTAVQTDPLIEEKYQAVAESESPIVAGLKAAGLTLAFSDSPVTPHRRIEHPSSVVSEMAATFAPMVLGVAGVSKTMMSIPKFATLAKAGKAGKAAFDGLARSTSIATNYLARNNEALFSEDEEIRDNARKNMAISIAATGVSPLPERFLPAGAIQPVAQGFTDLLAETLGQAFAGDNAFSKENIVNTVASVSMGFFSGVADMRGADAPTKEITNAFQAAVKTAPVEPDAIKSVPFTLSKERSEAIDGFIRRSLEESQTPAKSNIIEPESPKFQKEDPEFQKEDHPSGLEAVRNVQQPPTEADLKLTVDKGDETPYIKDHEQTIKPQPDVGTAGTREQGIDTAPINEGSRPPDPPPGEGIGGETPEPKWTYGDARPEVEATLSETSPQTFDANLSKNVADEIDRLDAISFKSDGMKSVNEEMDVKLQEAKKAERVATQRGSIRLPGESSKTTGGNQDVAKTLEAGRYESLNPVEKIKTSITGTVESLKKNFTKYEADIEKFPQYKDNKRTQFVTLRRNLNNVIAKYRHASLGKLHAKEGKQGLRKATDILILKNLRLRGQRGQTLENNLTVKDIDQHLEWLESTSSPEVLNAAEDMKAILKGAGEELVARGKLKAEALEEDYFPHKVLDYTPDFMRGLKTPMNRKFGEPYRPYTRKALGSKRLISSDDSVIWTHISKVLADNAQEDWMSKQALQYDAMHKIDPARRGKLYKGAEEVIDGKRYKVVEWKKTRHRVKAIDEKKLAEAAENDMLVKDWMQSTGPKGGKPIRDVVAMGKPKLYLLPKEIAVDLDNLIEKSPPIFDLIYSLGSLTQKWKGLTLTTALLPYQAGNLIGDAISTSVFDPAAHAYLPKATRVALKMFYPDHAGKAINLTDFEKKLLKVANEKDVASSGMTAELRFNVGKGLLNKYQKASEYRESLMRLSVLAHQLDRADKGKPVQNLAGIDLAGLDPESAAGKVSRETLIDYAAVPRSYQLFLSRGMLPFVRFAEGNFRNYARAVTRNKGTHKAYKTAAPIVGAYAAQWAYNNLDKDKKELEMQLPEYMRNRWHLNLGETDESNIAVWAPQQPVDMAMSWLGLDNINRISSDLMENRITPKQAAEEFLGAASTGAVENVQTLLNPVIQAWTGLKTNKDPFTGRKVMPDAVHKQGPFSKYGRKYAIGYLGEKIFAPIAQYSRTKRGTDPVEHPLFDWIKDGPVNVKRAFGFYEIDPSTQDLANHFKVAGPIDAAGEYYRTLFYDILDEHGEDLVDGLKARKEGTALTDSQQKAVSSVEKLTNKAKDNGFSALAYGGWLKNLTAQRKIVNAELRKTTNEARRAELRGRKKELLKGSQSKYIKQVSKTARKRYVDEMNQLKSLPKGE